MAEYISREAVEQVLCGIANGLSVGEAEALKVKGVKALYKIQGAKEILNAVDNDLSFIPAADVQPVKHGKWEEDTMPYDNFVVCSECGMNLSPQNYTKEEWQESFKYCPNCGARMDGDAE